MKSFFFLLTLFFSQILFSQSLESVVYDKENEIPVIFASVYTTQETGVITNGEGAFKINIDNLSEKDSLIITSLGYEKLSLSLNQLKGLDTIFIKEQKEMLTDVVISANKLSAEDIVQRFIDSISKRHHIEPTKFKVFLRTHDKLSPRAFEMDLKKSTAMTRSKRKTFNDQVEKYFSNIKGRESNAYEDILYDAYYLKDSIGIHYIKGTRLVNVEKDNSTETIQKNIFKELLSALETSSTFKVKSGLFPIDDSLSTEEFIQVKDSLKKDTLQNKFETNSIIKSLTQNLASSDLIGDREYYKFSLASTKLFDGEVVYEINFEPDHRKAKYKGKLYINAEDFGLMRLDYNLLDGEKEQGVNLKFLLGLKYRVDQSEYQIIYQRHQNKKYYPKYYRAKRNQYVYLDRSISFKENTDDRKNRIKLKLDFYVENDNIKQEEYLFMTPENLVSNTSEFNPEKYVFKEQIDTYNPKIWEEYNIIQATEGIKNYKY